MTALPGTPYTIVSALRIPFVWRTTETVRALVPLIGVSMLVCVVTATDWPELRGPTRNGYSSETNLPDLWSPQGENLIWRAPYGSASGPVVLGDRVYLQNAIGDGTSLQ